MDSAPIPDDLLLEIFLRVRDPADLVRFSFACASFGRLVACRSFLRRYRKRHAPPIVGFLDHDRVFHPVDPPYPSASSAKAVALAADLSFSFLPAPASDWAIFEIRDGRVLLARPPYTFAELVVCDPLHRRHLLLPPTPAVRECFPSAVNNTVQCDIFLESGGGGEEEEAAEETSFRVIWKARYLDKQVAFVFSSSTGQWRSAPWTAGLASFSWHEYVNGCFYGVTECREKLNVLDTRTMELSLVDLPPEAIGCTYLRISFVEAGEGITGMFVLPYKSRDLSYFIRRNNGGSSSQWQLEKIIPVGAPPWRFKGSARANLFLSSDAGLFSLDIKTFQFERVVRPTYMIYPWAYTNFPPLLSTPTVSSDTREGEEKEMLEQGGEMLQAEEPTGRPHGESTADDANAGDQAGVSRTGDGAD